MFKVHEIITATGGVLVVGNKKDSVNGVSTDTRTMQKGDLFIAIKGENFDGHDYLNDAVSKGASCLVVSSIQSRACLERSKILFDKKKVNIIEVEDTVTAYGELAKYHRRLSNIPIIAVTGSNGKTTTKEMIYAALSKKYNVLKNEGTQNNHIGVPSTLLKIRDDHDMVVLELGTNHPGEIKRLAEIAAPNMGIITNIGLSHMEFFKNINNVLKEKLDIFSFFTKQDTAILNGDDELLKKVRLDCKIVTYGTTPSFDYFATDIRCTDNGIDYLLNVKERIKLDVFGEHNVSNSLAAIACAKEFKVAPADIKSALENFKLPKMRMEKLLVNNILLINDAYNSNPQSMRSGIETLKNLRTKGKRILVSADMLELGDKSPDFHYKVGKFAAESGLDYVLAVGDLSKNLYKGAKSKANNGQKAMWFKDSKKACEGLLDIARPNDVILVKGSRGMKMEELVSCFTTYFTR